MKWRKLGQIFDCTKFGLNFAQSPQTLILPDRVRIYFSTRTTDPVNGKFLSQVAFVDMDKKLENIIARSEKPVITLGALGAFDEHGIFPISIFQENNTIAAYTCGWSRRKSVSVETSTGYAISHDQGLTFNRHGIGPVFGASLNEPCLVGDSFIRKYDGTYHMWYIYGQRWIKESENAQPDRVYKIAHAVSNDGLEWHPEGRDIIADVLDENECQALPSVLKIDDTWHMYFCFRAAFGFRTDPSKAYRLGYAYSKDLKNWTRDDSQSGITISTDGWDSSMMCYPHIFEVDGRVYLLYNGNQFGQSGFGAAILEN